MKSLAVTAAPYGAYCEQKETLNHWCPQSLEIIVCHFCFETLESLFENSSVRKVLLKVPTEHF